MLFSSLKHDGIHYLYKGGAAHVQIVGSRTEVERLEHFQIYHCKASVFLITDCWLTAGIRLLYCAGGSTVITSLALPLSLQVLPVRRAVPTPALPLRSEAVPVHRLREEVRPQRSPVETPQSPPLSTKQQDRTLCKLTPLTPLWQTDVERERGGRRGPVFLHLCVTKDRGREGGWVSGGVKVQTPFKGVRAGLLSFACVFMFKYVRVTYIHGTVIIYWVVRKRL